MSKEIRYSITRCYDCPYATNSARLHNDPFTSSPVNIYWYCTKKVDGFGDFMIIDDAYNGVDKNCPLPNKR